MYQFRLNFLLIAEEPGDVLSVHSPFQVQSPVGVRDVLL